MGIKTLIDFRDSEDIIKTSPELGFDNVINLPGSLHYRQNLLPRLEKEELRRGDANLWFPVRKEPSNRCSTSCW